MTIAINGLMSHALNWKVAYLINVPVVAMAVKPIAVLRFGKIAIGIITPPGFQLGGNNNCRHRQPVTAFKYMININQRQEPRKQAGEKNIAAKSFMQPFEDFFSS